MDGISQDATTVIVSKVPVSLVNAMKQISDARDRAFSAEVRRAMREHVEAHDRMLVEEAGLPPLVKAD
jgi:hypothetical protein